MVLFKLLVLKDFGLLLLLWLYVQEMDIWMSSNFITSVDHFDEPAQMIRELIKKKKSHVKITNNNSMTENHVYLAK